MIGDQDTQPLIDLAPVSDRDNLEFLLYLLQVMKDHGKAFYARKMPADEKLFAESKEACNKFIQTCKKRGYSYDRYKRAEPKQLAMAFGD